MFSVFGKIVDLRITIKAQPENNKGQIPNNGLITFEDPASALKMLNAQVNLNEHGT